MQRRGFMKTGALAMLLPAAFADAAPQLIQVYKSATCGCCNGWVEHLRKNDFAVKAYDVVNPSDYREKFGVPEALGSCHTAQVGGYALEGHVPAREIKRLLAERPQARGLAVPAMPMGSPGMEGARGDAYDVLLFQANGNYSVYRHYGVS